MQTELLELVSKYYKLLEYRKLIDKELNKLRSRLLQQLSPDSKIRVGEFEVVVRKYKQSRLDVGKLKEFLGESYSEFMIETEVVRLEVKKK